MPIANNAIQQKNKREGTPMSLFDQDSQRRTAGLGSVD